MATVSPEYQLMLPFGGYVSYHSITYCRSIEEIAMLTLIAIAAIAAFVLPLLPTSDDMDFHRREFNAAAKNVRRH
jgi:hypothetical protein